MRFIFLPFLLILLVSCATPPAGEKMTLTPVSFADLDGWQQDDLVGALSALQKSCAVLTKKESMDRPDVLASLSAWQQACAARQDIPLTETAVRAYFENYFRPYAVSGPAGSDGLFTGYYLPELRGSMQRTADFPIPLYERPHDMISVDLGAFKNDLNGLHIVGKVQANQLIPYDDRRSITGGSLAGRAEVLVWVADPIDAFFLEVQGSGRIRLPDDTLMPIGYDGANGNPYVAIGRILADQGDLQSPITMPAIRAWLVQHPQMIQEVLNRNPSYVFFRRLPSDDAIGAEGVALTAVRSLAVDPAFIPLGTPVWLDTADAHGAPLQRLMIAQDTGGAIKGVVRGDVFWGAGDTAIAQAGAMQSRGHYYLLLPITLVPHDQ